MSHMKVSPESILPSQNFIKPGTVRFIFECLRTGNTEDLPPTPLVRKNEKGQSVAIDGHNRIVVSWFMGEDIEVFNAKSASDGLPPTSAANITRNQELAAKFDTVLEEQQKVAAEGIESFGDLIAKYPELFV
jgi:hypothetical protein